MAKSRNIDFTAIREGLQQLPRTAHHNPGEKISPEEIVVVSNHRAALDPDRALVVGNRGVGKSFWAHALADPKTRAYVAKRFRDLSQLEVIIGFNAASRADSAAPTINAVNEASSKLDSADALWRTVLVRVAWQQGASRPASLRSQDFVQDVEWVHSHGEQVDRILTELDDRYESNKRKLVVVFDALDRLGTNWTSRRTLTTSLLKLALAVRSYRAIRLKLFMRRDQFEDPLLFQFPDGSKIRNQRVDLQWNSTELYTLLLSWLVKEQTSAIAMSHLLDGHTDLGSEIVHQQIIKAIAGEFMGNTPKQGRVYTWLPLHLSDARSETSPRTFLTAWREAACQEPAPAKLAVDYRGIHEGVRKASEDRLSELKEDYWWISLALDPLGGQQVPMERSALKRLWSTKRTASTILSRSDEHQLPPVRLDTAKRQNINYEEELISDLVAIGIVEIRPNDKINIPDIFRLEAGIKRKGGVPAFYRE